MSHRGVRKEENREGLHFQKGKSKGASACQKRRLLLCRLQRQKRQRGTAAAVNKAEAFYLQNQRQKGVSTSATEVRILHQDQGHKAEPEFPGGPVNISKSQQDQRHKVEQEAPNGPVSIGNALAGRLIPLVHKILRRFGPRRVSCLLHLWCRECAGSTAAEFSF